MTTDSTHQHYANTASNKSRQFLREVTPHPLPINLIERSNGVFAHDRITAGVGWQTSATQKAQTELSEKR